MASTLSTNFILLQNMAFEEAQKSSVISFSILALMRYIGPMRQRGNDNERLKQLGLSSLHIQRLRNLVMTFKILNEGVTLTHRFVPS